MLVGHIHELTSVCFDLPGMSPWGFSAGRLCYNAGLGALRDIWTHIGHAEPRFKPSVYLHDMPGTGSEPTIARNSEGVEDALPDMTDLLPKSNYAAAEYRSSYLSGELTALAVVKAILPLIRRGISPPGLHSAAWIDVKVDLIVAAAEESMLRYKPNNSFGLLDGVPADIKDVYDVDGYSTTFCRFRSPQALARFFPTLPNDPSC